MDNELSAVLDRKVFYTAGIKETLEGFKEKKPFKREYEVKKRCFNELHDELNTIHQKTTKIIFDESLKNGSSDSGESCYVRGLDVIVLNGRLSLITYLHEYAHALGYGDELDARCWSIALFRDVFPFDFSRLVYNNGMLVKPGRASP